MCSGTVGRMQAIRHAGAAPPLQWICRRRSDPSPRSEILFHNYLGVLLPFHTVDFAISATAVEGYGPCIETVDLQIHCVGSHPVGDVLDFNHASVPNSLPAISREEVELAEMGTVLQNLERQISGAEPSSSMMYAYLVPFSSCSLILSGVWQLSMNFSNPSSDT